ncbi:hypothetical protein ACOME3_007341 [Neoechinorhynchus agilis]
MKVYVKRMDLEEEVGNIWEELAKLFAEKTAGIKGFNMKLHLSSETNPIRCPARRTRKQDIRRLMKQEILESVNITEEEVEWVTRCDQPVLKD